MKELLDPYALLVILLWITGGVLVLYLVAKKEKRRLGGKLFSHLLEDIQEKPTPAIIGFSLLFMSSWIGATKELFFKEETPLR